MSAMILSLLALWCGVVSGGSRAFTRTLQKECYPIEGACADCNAQRFMNWPGFDMLLTPRKTDNPQECCDACRQRYGCRAWLLNVVKRECSLKEDVGFPIPCPDCVGGILDEDPFSELTACRALGRSFANRAAQASCQEVRNACNSPLSKERVIEYPPALPQVRDFPTKDERVICKFYIRETCKQTVTEAARDVDSECYSLAVEHGPATSTAGCANRNQAKRMFTALAEAICETSI